MATGCDLPGLDAGVSKWQLDGSCQQENPDVFFHPDGERGKARRSRDSAAKAVCRGCPVLETCREHALRVHEAYGVWGAMTEHERQESKRPPVSQPRVRASGR